MSLKNIVSKIINKIKNSFNKIMCKKKTLLSVGILFSAFALFLFAPNAFANVTGDLPGADTGNFYIAAFSDAQDSPCDGTADDGETKYAEHDAISGDATYNDDNDYLLTFSDVDATTFVYFCEDGTTNILANASINHDEVAASHIVDLGRVTGNGLHADLTNDYVIICDGSTQLSTINKQIAANTYDQYFVMDDQDNDYSSVRAYFAAASGDGCTFDASMSTGKTITTTTSLPDNYGIYTTFAPDTKNIGDLHADLDAAQFFLYNSSVQNIGFAIESYTDAGVPDGDGADDDYTIYYDKPTSGDMKLSIISASNGTTDVYGVAYDTFTAGYDFYLDIEDATGGVPSTVSYLRYVGTAGAGDAVTYVQDPRVSGSVQLFDLYIDTGDGTDVTEVYDGGTVTTAGAITGGTKVFEISKNLSDAGDEAFDVASVIGEMHSAMETGDDLIAIYSDNTCSTLVSSETVYPVADGFNTTDDYEIYFSETGANYYIKLTEEAGGTDYVSCGNHFTLTNQAKTAHDIAIQISGTRHADMAAALIDNDKGATLSNGDVWTTSFVTNVYHTYTVSDSASQVIFDDTDQTFAAILLTTVTEKDFSTSTVVSAAKVSGADTNIHGDLENNGGAGTNDLIMVTVASASGAGTDLASVAGIIDSTDDAEVTDDTYKCYFEVPSGGLVNFEIQDGDAANAVLAYVYNFTAEGAGSYTFEPSSKVTATFPLTALGLEIQQGDLGGYNIRDNTSTFIIYVDKTEEGNDAAYDYRAYTEAAFTNVVLDRSGKDVSGVATWGVNTVTNTAIHADITGDTDPVDVYSTAAATADCSSTLLSSDTTQVWAAGSKKYFERANGDKVNLKITDGSYVSCVNTLAAAAAAGGNNAYSLDVKTSGNINPDMITVYIDSDEDDSDDISQTAVVGTPSTYAILWAGDGDADIAFYDVTPTLQLDRDSKNLAASATVNVAKVSGTSQAGITTMVVYSDVACSTAVSTETENPTTSYSQYFEGVDATIYYAATGDGTFTSCLNSGFTPSSQAATANFDRKISGTTTDKDSTTLDVLSATADTGDDTYWTNTVDGAGTATYAIYVDDADSLIATSGLNFQSAVAGGGTTLLSVTKDASSGDATANVSAAYGASHADLDHANAVCSDHAASNVTCTTKYSTVPANGAGATYEIFFEQQAGTAYFIEVLDHDTQDYYSWNPLTSAAAGAYTNVELDGKLYGSVREAYDTAVKVPAVTAKMYTNGGDPETNQIALTYSYAGTTAPGGTYRMYGNSGTDYDAQFSKNAYISQTDDANVLSVEQNIDLVSGVKVIVREQGSGNLVTDATVRVYSCSGATASTCTTTLETCTAPSGDCTRIGDNTAGNGSIGEYYFSGITTGNYIRIVISKSNYSNIYDPDPVYSSNPTYQISASTVQPDGISPTAYTYYLENPGPNAPTLVTPVDKLVTTDTTPDLAWSDLGGDETDYEAQVDDNADFSSVHAGGGTTGSGATVTFTVDSALTDDTLYYWRVRGIDATGNGAWSIARSFYVNAGWNTMAAPTLANTAMTSPVTVSWTAETGATSYRIYRKNATPVAATDTYVGTSVSNSFIDTNPADGSWYYGVVPVDGSNTAGTISTTSAVVAVDTAAPTDVSISITGGAEYATASSTTITVAANGVVNMQFSCDGDNYTVAEAYATTKTFNLRTETGAGCTDADGSKIVYVKMLDTAGNYTVASDEIVLDTVAPVVSGANVAVSVSGGQVTVTWTASTDATAGVDSYSVYRKTATPVATSDTKVVSGLTAVGFVDAFSADGTYYYGITTTDKAGNTSVISTTSAVATVDVTGPNPVAMTINSNALYSTSATLTLTLSAVGATDMVFSCDGSTWGTEEVYGATKSLVLGSYGGACTATDALKLVYVKMMDANDNTTYAFDYITLDTTVPNVTLQSPLDNATSVAIAVAPTITFDSVIDISTITSSIQLRKYSDDSAVSATLGYNSTTNIVTIVPLSSLSYATQYYIYVSGVKDLAGNSVTAYTTKASQEFTTVSAPTGSLAVTSIYQTRSYGTADASWTNGWQWIVNATIPTNELSVALKFTDWTGVGSATLAAASNMRYYCAQSNYANTDNAVTISAAATYGTAMTVVAASDIDTSTSGIQIQVYVETKIPAATTAGSYSTSYGLQSS